jgi:hypothetical protein
MKRGKQGERLCGCRAQCLQQPGRSTQVLTASQLVHNELSAKNTVVVDVARMRLPLQQNGATLRAQPARLFEIFGNKMSAASGDGGKCKCGCIVRRCTRLRAVRYAITFHENG